MEFGGIAATEVDVVSSTEITAKTPPHGPGPVGITVRTSAGTGESSPKANLFAYVQEPRVTITSPHGGSVTLGTAQVVTGEAGTEEGDSGSVTVNLFQGSGPGVLLESRSVPVSPTGQWSTTFSPLAPGVYSLAAEQYGETGSGIQSGGHVHHGWPRIYNLRYGRRRAHRVVHMVAAGTEGGRRSAAGFKLDS